MSIVFYKFKSAKDYDKVTFDGNGISVFELKRDIMISKKLGKGTDFDLLIFNAQTNEEYVDDSYLIPRNSSVLVARLPAAKVGKGTAQNYVGTNTLIPTRGDFRPNVRPRLMQAQAPSLPTSNLPDQDSINAMFQQQEEQWQHTQNQMAAARPIYRAKGYEPEPPPGYVCHRCGKKGHFKNSCPTLTDPNFDKPMLKRTTGIPKTFLQTIASREQAGDNVMVSQTGELVVVQSNDSAWRDLNKRAKIVSQTVTEVPKELECGICKKLLHEAVTSTCCKSNFCDDCIRIELIEPSDPENKLKCPICHEPQVPDQLMVNKSLREAVLRHLRKRPREEEPEPKSRKRK